jgi:hypothetical protein
MYKEPITKLLANNRVHSCFLGQKHKSSSEQWLLFLKPLSPLSLLVGGDSRGHGAADHLDRQGRYPSFPECAHVYPGRCKSDGRTIRQVEAPQGKASLPFSLNEGCFC